MRQWLAALSGHVEPDLPPGLRGAAETFAALDRWAAPLTGVMSHAALRSGLRLIPPDRSEDGHWELELILQTATDPALNVPAASAWAAAGEELLVGDQRYRQAEQRLLTDLPARRRFDSYETVTDTADQVVARYLAVISKTAADLTAGDRAPIYGDEPPAGKRAPVKHRLAQEIEEAAEQAGTVLTLKQLHAACPTAAPWLWQAAEPALAEALTVVRPEFVTPVGESVGLRTAVLGGATLRHVITLTEWQRGRLSAGSDWEHALRMAGHSAPFAIQVGGTACRVLDPDRPSLQDDLFRLLRPMVGDELRITVTDADAPVVTGTLVRLKEGSQRGLLDRDRAAAERLRRYLERPSVWAVTEAAAVEILCAHGFYREGTPPDPMWLLPVAAHDRLNWSRERRLTRASWYERELAPGRPVNGIWPDRQAALHRFLSVRSDARLASACLEAWCQFWPGDQGNTRHRPTAAALAHFLWHIAPRQFRAAGSAPLEVMASWFRFLAERYPLLRTAYWEHLALCELSWAYAHRLQTLPAANDTEGMTAWTLEGYRWLGPEPLF